MIVSNTGFTSAGKLERTLSMSAVARCCSRASASSRLYLSSCCSRSARGLRIRPTCALAFVPVERSLRPRVGLFPPLRDKVTSSAQTLGLPILAHDELASSLDHLVGGHLHDQRYGKAKCLGGLQVDDQLEFSLLQHGQVRRSSALNDLAGVDACLAICIRDAGAVTHQAASGGKLTRKVNRGHGVACCQPHEL